MSFSENNGEATIPQHFESNLFQKMSSGFLSDGLKPLSHNINNKMITRQGPRNFADHYYDLVNHSYRSYLSFLQL